MTQRYRACGSALAGYRSSPLLSKGGESRTLGPCFGAPAAACKGRGDPVPRDNESAGAGSIGSLISAAVRSRHYRSGFEPCGCSATRPVCARAKPKRQLVMVSGRPTRFGLPLSVGFDVYRSPGSVTKSRRDCPCALAQLLNNSPPELSGSVWAGRWLAVLQYHRP